MIFRPREGRSSVAVASECVFRNRRRRERCYRRLCATGYCYRGIVVVVDDDDGGGGVLPAFPGRFSHHRGI